MVGAIYFIHIYTMSNTSWECALKHLSKINYWQTVAVFIHTEGLGKFCGCSCLEHGLVYSGYSTLLNRAKKFKMIQRERQ